MPTSPTPVSSECTQQQGSLPAPTPRGRLVVLTGPSGVGKGTLVNQLRQRHPELYLSVSVTTRPPPAPANRKVSTTTFAAGRNFST
jgi:guanylate kinase